MQKAVLFTKENTLLVVVDIQEKLADQMPERERLVKNTGKLVKIACQLEIPIIVTEQYPNGLGRTLPELEPLLMNVEPIEKISFSCCLEDCFINALTIENRNYILLAGIETHICVMQTALDLVNRGFAVGVVEDAVCSFNRNDKDIALQRMHKSGVLLTTTEMILFELLRKAGTDDFKELLPILRER